MAKIREDLVGVVVALLKEGGFVTLRSGETVPDDIEVGSHVLENPAESMPPIVDQAPSSPRLSPPPPRAGKGSNAKAWRSYAIQAVAAAGLNIDIPEDAQRGDIIAALVDAQIRVE